MHERTSAPQVRDDAIPEGTPCRSGTFEYDVVRDRLVWSDALFRIYGYSPGEVRPTTALLVDASHPDDRAQVTSVLASTLASGIGCVHAHRIVTPAGETRHVVIVGSAIKDASGALDRFTGYAVDVTRTTEDVVTESVNDAIQSVVAARAVIEQAKGVLMLAFGVDADTAFGVLSWQSQTYNLKLRALAEQIVEDIACPDRASDELRSRISHVLLTAHERVGASN